MSFLDGLMGGLVDKEQITKDYITDALSLATTEFKLERKELMFFIKPVNDQFEFKIYIIHWDAENNIPKKFLREITVKEIVDSEDKPADESNPM